MRLRQLRIAKGRQQKELAKKIGTDEPMMSKFENYKCLPTPSMMNLLVKELGCSVDDIYEPHEVYYQKNKPTAKEKKESPAVYNLSVRLPAEAKAFLKKALKKCGFKDITAWVVWCYERLQTQYEHIVEAEKKDSTPACKQSSEV
jgi:transcriptional regulator with XRE-family HTH domain